MNLRPSRAAAVAVSLVLFASACGGGETATTLGDTDQLATTSEVGVVPTTAPIEESTAEESTAEGSTAEESTAEAAPASAPTEEATAAVVSAEPETAPEPDTAEPPSITEVALQLPALPVVDLTTDRVAELTSFARPGATLVWFWAPH